MTSQAYRENFSAIDWSGLIPRTRRGEQQPKRSDLACPMIISDEMPAGHHPHDGKAYTSKSAWRAVNRAGGYVEVGNDPARNKPRQKPKADRKAIRASIERARARVTA